MTSEFLLDAIGQLDDDLILEARRPRRRLPFRTLGGLAAALILCAGILANAPLPGRSGDSQPPKAAEAQDSDPSLYADQEYVGQDGADRGGTPQYSVTSGSIKDSAAAGAFQPRIHTTRGTYLPIVLPSGAVSPTLPVDAISLGALQPFPGDDASLPSTSDPELVGCPVWESADGERLYVRLPDGWLTAGLISDP